MEKNEINWKYYEKTVKQLLSIESSEEKLKDKILRLELFVNIYLERDNNGITLEALDEMAKSLK